MDRIVPRRPRAGLSLVLALPTFLWLAQVVIPATDARASLPTLCEDQTGDPGDGVLRPAGRPDVSDASLVTTGGAALPVVSLPPTESAPLTFLPRLVPVLPPPGQPWLLTFRLIRVARASGCADAVHGAPDSGVGRWHRAF